MSHKLYFYVLTALFGFAGLFGLITAELSYLLFINSPPAYAPTVEKGVFRLVSYVFLQIIFTIFIACLKFAWL